jgi:hypothetical protein
MWGALSKALVMKFPGSLLYTVLENDASAKEIHVSVTSKQLDWILSLMCSGEPKKILYRRYNAEVKQVLERLKRIQTSHECQFGEQAQIDNAKMFVQKA